MENAEIKYLTIFNQINYVPGVTVEPEHSSNYKLSIDNLVPRVKMPEFLTKEMFTTHMRKSVIHWIGDDIADNMKGLVFSSLK